MIPELPPTPRPPDPDDPKVARLPIVDLHPEQVEYLPRLIERMAQGYEPPKGKCPCDRCDRMVSIKAEGMTLSRMWVPFLGDWWVNVLCVACAQHLNPRAVWFDDDGRSLAGEAN